MSLAGAGIQHENLVMNDQPGHESTSDNAGPPPFAPTGHAPMVDRDIASQAWIEPPPIQPRLQIAPPLRRDPRPALWPAIVITVGVLPLSCLVGGIIGMIAVFSNMPSDVDADFEDAAFFGSPSLMAVMVIAVEIIMLTAALLGAAIARRPWGETLGLRRPQGSQLLLLLLVLGTMTIQAAIGLLLNLVLPEWFLEDDIFTSALRNTEGAGTIALVAALSVLPGVCEEMLFRGYLQRRLLMWWPALGAIALASSLFAMIHLAPLQVVAVFPLGIWFGIIAWRTGSIWFAAACHIVNNIMAFTMYLYVEVIESVDATRLLIALGIGILALIGSIVMMFRRSVRGILPADVFDAAPILPTELVSQISITPMPATGAKP
jgi:membrane protease YdiL (CAAX protease family)